MHSTERAFVVTVVAVAAGGGAFGAMVLEIGLRGVFGISVLGVILFE
jgi:hypothetical protein